MASNEKKQLENLLKPCLKEIGFKKKGATWHRANSDFIQVVNIQGSQWSKIFYINLGVYLKQLGDEQTPVEYKCHIRTRLSQLVPDLNRLNELCDIHSSDFEGFDRSELQDLLINYGVSWLDKCCTQDGIKNEINLGRSMISKIVKDRV
jgi:hypothetical protein